MSQFRFLRRLIGFKAKYLSGKQIGFLFVATVAPLCFVGDSVDDWYWERKRRERNETVMFQPGSVEETQMHKLGTGDVILISTRLWSFNPHRMLVTIMNKWVHRTTAYDHCGLIIQERSEEGFPYIVEKGFDGVKVSPWDMWLMESRNKAIVQRHLVLEMTPERWEIADKFLEECRNQVGKEGAGLFQCLMNILRHPRSSLGVAAEILQLHRTLMQLEYKLKHAELGGVKQSLLQQIAKLKGRISWKRKEMDRITKALPRTSKFPCAQLVADFWMQLSVLPPRPYSKEYFTVHFADVTKKLPFAPGTGLQKTVALKYHVSETFTGGPAGETRTIPANAQGISL